TGATGYRIERSTDGTTFTTLATPGNVTTYSDASVTPLGEYYYRVVGINSLTESITTGTVIYAAAPAATTLAAPWASSDIGSVGGTGAAGLASGTYTVDSGGTSLSTTADTFRYVY